MTIRHANKARSHTWQGVWGLPGLRVVHSVCRLRRRLCPWLVVI